MKAEKEDRPATQYRKQRNPWIVVGAITAVNAAILFVLAKIGWGITIVINKLSEAFYINGSKNTQQATHENIAPPQSQ
ncbi:hypothetical protein D3C78_726280 [compost metagenome]